MELAGHAQSAVQAEQMLREAAAGLNVGFRSLQSDLRRIQRQKYRPTPATEPSAPPPPAVERPADELELAQLLGTHSDPELTGLVRQWLRYDLITDADCRAWTLRPEQAETFRWLFLQLLNERTRDQSLRPQAEAAWLSLLLIAVQRWAEGQATETLTPDITR